LLAKIHRLKIVSEMIGRQQTAIGDSLPADVADLGACVLGSAVELDRWMFRGVSFEAALERLKSTPHGFPREVLDALKDYSPSLPEFGIKRLPVSNLRVSMITDDDIVTSDGNFMILRKGSVLNATAIERIRNFDRTRGIPQPIQVRVPQAGRT